MKREVMLIFIYFISVCFYSSYGFSKCDISDEEGLRHLDIRIPELDVPKNLTSYVCQQFKVPDDLEYNAIAFEGLITNPDVVHHILVFGCDFEVDTFEPHECGAYDSRCGSWLAQWTIGIEGKTCTYNDTGIRFGKNSYKYMSIQIHWNNNNFDKDYKDNSGIRMYYTNKLRQYSVGHVQVGQNDLEIPAGSKHKLSSGGCSSTCTERMLPHPVYLTKTYIHMHNLGVEGKLDIYREGKLVQEVAHDTVYNYHKSPTHYHDPPVEVRPGDEVRLSCWFSSDRNHTVYFGEGSDAEMCYAFVTYYPKVEGFDQCIQFDKYDVNCVLRGEPYMGGCNLQRMEHIFDSNTTSHILDTCSSGNICSDRCNTVMTNVLEQPCMKGRFRDYVERITPPKIQGWDALINAVHAFESTCKQQNVSRKRLLLVLLLRELI